MMMMLVRHMTVCLLVMVKCIVTEQVQIVANTSDHKFNCGVNIQDTVTWYRYKQESDPVDSHSKIEPGYHYKLDSNSLTICNIIPAVEGYYYCMFGDTKKNASRLIVLGVPDISPIGPELQFLHGSNITFDVNIQFINGGPANETVNINYVELLQPSAGVIYCYDNQCNFNYAASHTEVSVTNDGWSRFSVIIANASDSDAGQYSVKVHYSVNASPEMKEIKFNISFTNTTATSSIVMPATTTFTTASPSVSAAPLTTSLTTSLTIPPTTPHPTTTGITSTSTNIITSSTSSITITSTNTTAPDDMKTLWVTAAAVVVAVIIILSIIIATPLVAVYRKRLCISKSKSSPTDSRDKLTTPTTDNKGQPMDPEPCYVDPHQFTIIDPSNSICDLHVVTLRPQEGTKFAFV